MRYFLSLIFLIAANSFALDIDATREEFPILNTEMSGYPLIYLDSAASSQKPKAMVDALTKFYLYEYSNINRANYELANSASKRFDETRQTIADFLNVSKDEIIFNRNTTEGINLVARSFGTFLQEGDEIIISDLEHHSNIAPWINLAKEKKLVVKVIPINAEQELDLDAYDKLLTSKTKLVSVTHIANATGALSPVEEIVKRAHKVGAKVLIDGAQAVSHIPVDLKKIDCDFYAFSAHKVYGPSGVGILYGKKELLEKMPPVIFGSSMSDNVSFSCTTLLSAPYKFEAGTPAIAEIIAFKESINFLKKIGMENVAAYEKTLTQYTVQKLSEIEGISIMGPKEKYSIISFNMEDVPYEEVANHLASKGIAIRSGYQCAQPIFAKMGIPGSNRISLAIYNTMEEIDHLTSALQELYPKERRTEEGSNP